MDVKIEKGFSDFAAEYLEYEDLFKPLKNVPKANGGFNLLYQLQKYRESDRPISEVLYV